MNERGQENSCIKKEREKERTKLNEYVKKGNVINKSVQESACQNAC